MSAEHDHPAKRVPVDHTSHSHYGTGFSRFSAEVTQIEPPLFMERPKAVERLGNALAE